MKATVRRQGTKTEVFDPKATFVLTRSGSGASGRILILGKDLGVTVELDSADLANIWGVLSRHFSGRDRE